MSDTEERHGWLVRRTGPPSSTPFEAGDFVDLFELLDDVVDEGQIDRAWRANPSWPVVDIHGLAEQEWRAVADAPKDDVRELRRLDCPCRKADPAWVAKLLRDKQGRPWVAVNRERVPASFGGPVRVDQSAWPMHVHPNGSPHVEVVTCRRCPLYWAVRFDDRSLQLVRIGKVRHAVRVQPD